MRYVGKILFCLFFAPFFARALPPPLPSAGVIEREIEQEYEAKPLDTEREIPSVEVDIPEEKFSMESDATVFVKQVKIEGNHIVSTKEIQGWIACLINKNLKIGDIYHICKVIDQHYAAKGYFLTRAYPPSQDICNDTLVIKILEGKIGTIRIEGNKFYSTRFIYRYFEPFCKQPLHYDQFLKALLLLNENSDLSAGAVFEKGQEVGTADLIVHVKDKRPIHLYLNGVEIKNCGAPPPPPPPPPSPPPSYQTQLQEHQPFAVAGMYNSEYTLANDYYFTDDFLDERRFLKFVPMFSSAKFQVIPFVIR